MRTDTMRRAVGLLLVVAVLGCSRPVEPLVGEFLEAVVDGDLDQAWVLATGGRDEPINQASAGSGYALDRGHFDATFGPVTAVERDLTSRWYLTRTDGTRFRALLAQNDGRVWVYPTTWSVTVIDPEGEPVALFVDGHPAFVNWTSRTHGIEWHTGIYTFRGPRVFEVELAGGDRLTARAVRAEEERYWRTCCVHFNGVTGEATVHRSGPPGVDVNR